MTCNRICQIAAVNAASWPGSDLQLNNREATGDFVADVVINVINFASKGVRTAALKFMDAVCAKKTANKITGPSLKIVFYSCQNRVDFSTSYHGGLFKKTHWNKLSNFSEWWSILYFLVRESQEYLWKFLVYRRRNWSHQSSSQSAKVIDRFIKETPKSKTTTLRGFKICESSSREERDCFWKEEDCPFTIFRKEFLVRKNDWIAVRLEIRKYSSPTSSKSFSSKIV